MSRALVIISTDGERQKALRWVAKAPWNTRVTFQGPKRSLPQNDRMWAALTDVSQQLAWHGLKLSPEDWKLLFMDALGGEMRLVPGINGNGFINLGRSSSRLDKEDFAGLLTIIDAFAAEHGVTLHERRASSPDAPPGDESSQTR